MGIGRRAWVGLAALVCACFADPTAPPPAEPAAAEPRGTREILLISERGEPVQGALVSPLDGPGAHRVFFRSDDRGRVALPIALAGMPVRIRALGFTPFVGRLEAANGVQVIRMRFAIACNLGEVVVTP